MSCSIPLLVLGIEYFDLKSMIDLIIFIGTVLVLYVNLKNTIDSLIIANIEHTFYYDENGQILSITE